ncbi:DszA family xenobiotic compound monooxygenase-2 [Coleophoma crateriformis]|uniref:DszA family xenobiotic compound monooxygenase-2 n=1 Tax=Coleophoma crateriformis TaxID=565419 RepID=A0A3D8RQF4_9HELO|nr:DszA family xenobiotic compound monooxygenase-2 [Coleophoma crateriformis]
MPSKTPQKRIQLSFLETCCTGGYMASGQWRSPSDNGKTKDRLKYYMDMARLAEKGKISCIFFADWYAGFDVYTDSMDPMLKAGHQVAHLDPIPIISAMASVTDTVAFAATASTSYVNPYILARQYSTLDHLTDGRVGWNIVTSWSKSAAKALGQDDVIPHDERYVIADEYMDLVYKLWESSWASDSASAGKYLKCSARNQVHPSPQRTPVLFQAGTSKTGSAFAAKHAEAVFLNTATVEQAAKVIKDMRVAAAAGGRDPTSLKFFPCIVPIIGRTSEEAQEKLAAAKKNADYIAGLGQFSGYTGIDMSQFPLDEPFAIDEKGTTAIQSVFRALEASNTTGAPWTPRTLGQQMALGGLHPCPVGSAEEVADVFQEWVNIADCDGFNIAYVSNPGSFEDVVEILRPELVKRGLMWEDYDVPGGTFRENLLGEGKTLREDHYGSRFKFGRDFEDDSGEVQAANGSGTSVQEVKA